ncbi:protein of unknown function [Hyphomicrobium sp. 1Nfss2.1]
MRSRSTCLRVRKPLSFAENRARLTLSNGVPFDGAFGTTAHEVQNRQNAEFTIFDEVLPTPMTEGTPSDRWAETNE